MLNKRTNILFDETTWGKLTKLAKAKNSSVGKLVRDAVEKRYIEDEKLETCRKAIDSTLKNRLISKRRINYKELINYGRKY